MRLAPDRRANLIIELVPHEPHQQRALRDSRALYIRDVAAVSNHPQSINLTHYTHLAHARITDDHHLEGGNAGELTHAVTSATLRAGKSWKVRQPRRQERKASLTDWQVEVLRLVDCEKCLVMPRQQAGHRNAFVTHTPGHVTRLLHFAQTSPRLPSSRREGASFPLLRSFRFHSQLPCPSHITCHASFHHFAGFGKRI